MDPVMDRETLAAFVDGSLSPEESAAVVLHLADHPADAAHVDALMELNVLLGEAFAEPLHQPAPPAILQAIRSLPAGRSGRAAAARRLDPRSGWRRLAAPGLRAGLTAALAVAGAVFLTVVVGPLHFGGRPVQILAAPPSADADLRAALETAPSGPIESGPSHQITLIGTFLDRNGRPCREYEILDVTAAALTQGVACRSGTGEWSTEVSVASRLDPAASRDAFVPAAGAKGDPETLDRALDRLGAGMTMPPGEENALLHRWRD